MSAKKPNSREMQAWLAERSKLHAIYRQEPHMSTGELADVVASHGALIEALERAYRFAWEFGTHKYPCALASDINDDTAVCGCGYDTGADVLMDDEDRLGFDFWKDARTPASRSASPQ